MKDKQTEHHEKQTQEQVAASGAQAGMQTAARSQEHKIENQQFLNELRKADLDSEVFGDLTGQFPSWFSGARAVSNRSETWDTEADLAMQNKRERAHAERNPGRLLRDRPMLLTIAQGRTETDQHGRPQPLEPYSSRQRRAMFGAAEVAADLMSLSKDGAGLEATTTATTETRVTRENESESTASRVGKVFE